jgi:glycine amidinotransferase
MYSSNEWGQLKKIIVGVTDYARIPPLDKSLTAVNYADVKHHHQIPVGPYPDQIIEESNEDLENFVEFLELQNIVVVRPKREYTRYYNYCPRDTVVVYKDLAIEAPMSIRHRIDEFRSYEHHLENIVYCDHYLNDDIYNENVNIDTLGINEKAVKFDAANIIRANDDLLYLVSNTGNNKGADYLQNVIGNRGKVRILKDVYSYQHIDSTIAFLREGLLLVNPARIKDRYQLPEPFNKWDIVWAEEPVDIGHYPGYCNASPWINLNLLSINENLVVLESRQEPLRKQLEKYNINCAMITMRHQRTLGGGFHCVTLDLIRNV